MIGKNTEKAIKAWLKLPKEDRSAQVNVATGKVELLKEFGHSAIIMATYTPQQVINKRLPRRKKAKAKK